MTRLPTLLFRTVPDAGAGTGTTGPVLTKVGERLPRPKAILVISAHWLTHQPTLSSSKAPETIHDFGGFPGHCIACNIRLPAHQSWRHKYRRC